MEGPNDRESETAKEERSGQILADTQLQIGQQGRHVQMSCDRFAGNYSDGLRSQFACGSMMTLIFASPQ